MKSTTAIILLAATISSAVPLLPRALDLGSCSNPNIVFGPGFDGRQQDSFQPADKTQFNHGSALNIGVITSFICGQLPSQCKAGADAVAACAAGQKAAAALTGQQAADAFNAAFAGGAAAPPAAGLNSTATATATPPAAACSAASSAASTAPPPGGDGANLQKFTGALGGIAASAVVDSGDAKRPFKVVADNSTDVNLKAALQRSCDIQHNACATAANTGKLAGGVAQCDAQQKDCVAA